MIKRWLFLILLLLNLLLFAWGYQRPLPESSVPSPLPPGEPTIQLLSESPTPPDASAQAAAKAPQPATGSARLAGPQPTPKQASSQASTSGQGAGPADNAAPPPPAAPDRRCVRLGPLEQQRTAFDLTEALAKAGHQTELKTETTHQQSGFWVLIALRERQVDTLVADLQAAGILDVWHFSKGPLAGTVSLGLYSDRARAEERRAVLTGKGFAAEIRPREVEVPTYWVRTHYVESDQEANSALEQAYNQYPALSFPPRPCRPAASAER